MFNRRSFVRISQNIKAQLAGSAPMLGFSKCGAIVLLRKPAHALIRKVIACDNREKTCSFKRVKEDEHAIVGLFGNPLLLGTGSYMAGI